MLGQLPVFPIILSTDLTASRAFYEGRLGLEVLDASEERLVLACGEGTRLVISRSTIGTRDTQTQLGWRVPDLDAVVADLRQRGIRIEEYAAPDPVTVDGVADMGHSRVAWIVDPDGNVLGLVEPKP